MPPGRTLVGTQQAPSVVILTKYHPTAFPLDKEAISYVHTGFGAY